ncbi:hypothetical protein IW261DRAFT_1507836 [Armillaria novae-zelandiae]|uniref:RING-type domain-containing protein n=1 Tax=Armillaria novae-zelandiae TaxID=153914 RepID=A0AA39UBE8_9AGAR|nr:hypothetical protein IW261DRAFT_1507836 [Armillaria novae-zelandiae]
MTCECAICLFKYHGPISLPCRHVYCSRCISDHISKTTTDVFTALCPTCRKSFHIGHVRHIYINPKDMHKLKEKAQALEAQVRQLKKDKKRVLEEQNKHLEEKSKELEQYKSKYWKLKETKTKASGTKRSSGTCSAMDAKRPQLEKSSRFSSPKQSCLLLITITTVDSFDIPSY